MFNKEVNVNGNFVKGRIKENEKINDKPFMLFSELNIGGACNTFYSDDLRMIAAELNDIADEIDKLSESKWKLYFIRIALEVNIIKKFIGTTVSRLYFGLVISFIIGLIYQAFKWLNSYDSHTYVGSVGSVLLMVGIVYLLGLFVDKMSESR